MKDIRFQGRKFSYEQLSEIALLHRAGISKGFLSSFSIAFLRQLYRAISLDPFSNLTIATDSESGSSIGFIAGTNNITSMYRRVIMRHGFLLTWLLLAEVFKVSFIKKCIETLFYPIFIDKKWRRSQGGGDPPEKSELAELLAIVVKDEVRRKGIGKLLVNELELYFKRQNISSYRVVTFSEDKVSNVFYSTMGFHNTGPFAFHGNILNTYTKVL
jgi:GNAT superfamily N-acetyltransferase